MSLKDWSLYFQSPAFRLFMFCLIMEALFRHSIKQSLSGLATAFLVFYIISYLLVFAKYKRTPVKKRILISAQYRPIKKNHATRNR